MATINNPATPTGVLLLLPITLFTHMALSISSTKDHRELSECEGYMKSCIYAIGPMVYDLHHGCAPGVCSSKCVTDVCLTHQKRSLWQCTRVSRNSLMDSSLVGSSQRSPAGSKGRMDVAKAARECQRRMELPCSLIDSRVTCCLIGKECTTECGAVLF